VQRADRPERGARLLDRAAGGVGLAEVGGDGFGAHALALEGPGGGSEAVGVAGDERECEALGGEPLGDRGGDAGTESVDDDRLGHAKR
jgi:hypothetical protein